MLQAAPSETDHGLGAATPHRAHTRLSALRRPGTDERASSSARPRRCCTRRTLRRKIKKTARLWIRIAATVPVTKKPLGIRMGKGKGNIDFYATPVRPGQIIFEMDRVPRQVALQAMQAVQHKFPCKLGFVEWN